MCQGDNYQWVRLDRGQRHNVRPGIAARGLARGPSARPALVADAASGASGLEVCCSSIPEKLLHCPACRPDWFSMPREGEYHAAVRFGDHLRFPFIEVFLDGEKEPRAVEACARRVGGYVIAVRRELCPCGSGLPAHEIKFGRVELRTALEEGSAC